MVLLREPVPPKEELTKKVQIKHRELKIDLDELDEPACSVPVKDLNSHDLKVSMSNFFELVRLHGLTRQPR